MQLHCKCNAFLFGDYLKNTFYLVNTMSARIRPGGFKIKKE